MQPINRREIVVARYKEDVSWLHEISPKWKITIYNKGPNDISELITTAKNITIIPLDNQGREAETYAYHMLNRYTDIADLTLYLQGNPFEHAPELLGCIRILEKKTKVAKEETYIPLTIRYTDTLPPSYITAARQNRFYRVDPISCYTLDCVTFPDRPVHIANTWLTTNKCKVGTNIIHKTLQQITNDTHIKETDTILMNFAACFALTRAGHVQYPPAFYAGLHSYSYKDDMAPYLLEKLWLHIFNKEFDASKVLPEYSMKRDVTLFTAEDNDIGVNSISQDTFVLENKMDLTFAQVSKAFEALISQGNAIQLLYLKCQQLLQQRMRK